ncbi:MAG: bifunctional ornithine acetyltransferase/N-acetylglutamate synthase, partial [Pseudomonadota bacterium]
MDALPVSPLAPKALPEAGPLAGVRLAVAETGMKYADRADLLLIVFDRPATAAGVFTKSLCPSAPVDWCRTALVDGQGLARAVLVNAGNANAFTGAVGATAVAESVTAVSEAVGCAKTEVFAASTGVIGEPLDASLLTRHVPALAHSEKDGHPVDDDRRARSASWAEAAVAIMTTDTYPK